MYPISARLLWITAKICYKYKEKVKLEKATVLLKYNVEQNLKISFMFYSIIIIIS